MNSARLAAWLSGLWGGLLLGIGAVAAPASFVAAVPEIAGRMAGRMFAHEAYLSLVIATVLLLLLGRLARAAAEAGTGSVLSANMLIVMGTLFCTIAGHFAVQPIMASAKAGTGMLSFGALHGISAGFFVLKTLLVGALSWRLTAVVNRPLSS